MGAVVIGRFAPTPSGRMHIGNVYAMLGAWLLLVRVAQSVQAGRAVERAMRIARIT